MQYYTNLSVYIVHMRICTDTLYTLPITIHTHIHTTLYPTYVHSSRPPPHPPGSRYAAPAGPPDSAGPGGCPDSPPASPQLLQSR